MQCNATFFATKMSKSIILNEKTLVAIEASLKNSKTMKWRLRTPTPTRAAVLLPLCKVENIPSVLFTVRSRELRTHGGEVSFPGGNQDDDETLLNTMLRESHEEIGLNQQQIRILGRMAEIPNKSFHKLVTPFVGYIGSIEQTKLQINPHEVSDVFHVPIQQLLDPNIRKIEQFRGLSVTSSSWPVGDSDLRIWGLTAFILHNFLNDCLLGPGT